MSIQRNLHIRIAFSNGQRGIARTGMNRRIETTRTAIWHPRIGFACGGATGPGGSRWIDAKTMQPASGRVFAGTGQAECIQQRRLNIERRAHAAARSTRERAFTTKRP
jgi:hypothetical protein